MNGVFWLAQEAFEHTHKKLDFGGYFLVVKKIGIQKIRRSLKHFENSVVFEEYLDLSLNFQKTFKHAAVGYLANWRTAYENGFGSFGLFNESLLSGCPGAKRLANRNCESMKFWLEQFSTVQQCAGAVTI